jgi:hypothetical protein
MMPSAALTPTRTKRVSGGCPMDDPSHQHRKHIFAINLGTRVIEYRLTACHRAAGGVPAGLPLERHIRTRRDGNAAV